MEIDMELSLEQIVSALSEGSGQQYQTYTVTPLKKEEAIKLNVSENLFGFHAWFDEGEKNLTYVGLVNKETALALGWSEERQGKNGAIHSVIRNDDGSFNLEESRISEGR